MSSISLTLLPYELVREIFQSISSFRDRLAFLRTCSTYHDLLVNDLYRDCLARGTDTLDNLNNRQINYVLNRDMKCAMSRFLNAGLPVDEKFPHTNNVLLAQACTYLAVECVEVLVKNGADVQWRDARGGTLLHILLIAADTQGVRCPSSRRKKALRILSLLLEAGVEVNRGNDPGNTALHYAVTVSRQCVEALIHAGASPLTDRNGYGASVLHTAVLYGSMETVRVLLRKGADVNGVDRNGDTALFQCVRLRDRRCLDVLLNNGATKLGGSKGKMLLGRIWREFRCPTRYVELVRKAFDEECFL